MRLKVRAAKRRSQSVGQKSTTTKDVKGGTRSKAYQEYLKKKQAQGAKPGRRPRQMSIDQILRYVPYEPDSKNARYVYCTRIVKNTRGGYNIYTTTRIPGEKPRQHRQYVIPVDPEYKGKISECPAVRVHCTCKRHTFMWEYALAKYGAAKIISGNGEPPYSTNPKMKPACCKHLLRGMLNLKARKL